MSSVRAATRGGVGGLRLGAEHEAVILDRGAAAAGVDQDRVQPGAVDLAGPGGDVGAGAGHRRIVLAHVMGQRAAAAGRRRHHHLGAHARQQPDRRRVDAGGDHLLRAAGQQRHPVAALALRRMGLRRGAGRGQPGRGEVQHRAAAGARTRLAAAARATGARARRRAAPAASARDSGSIQGQRRRAAGVRARGRVIGLLDMAAGRGRPGACSSRPDGHVVMQDRHDRQRSTCRTSSSEASRPDSSMSLIR